MSETPATPAPAAPKFGDLWNECFSQRERYTIWRDHFRREAEAARATNPDYAARCEALAADRGRLVEIYDVMARLIERVRDDATIIDRLRQIAADEAAETAHSGDEVSADD